MATVKLSVQVCTAARKMKKHVGLDSVLDGVELNVSLLPMACCY